MGASILALGGVVAAGLQTFGYVKTAGFIMLLANLCVIVLTPSIFLQNKNEEI